MRELNELDVRELLEIFLATTVSGTFCVNRVVSGKYFVWTEKVVKLRELPESVANHFRALMDATGAQRIEAICSEKTGEPDRLKVVVVP